MRSDRGAEARPAVDPIGALDSALSKLRPRLRRVGEERVAYLFLAATFAIAAVLILVWGRGQSFVNDEWSYLVVRDFSLEAVLTPQNGHLIAVPLLLYETLFATLGADSHLPFQVATVALHLTVALLFFLLVRPRAQLPVAVALTVLVVFFGAGWDTIMGGYEIPNLVGMAAGLAMLLALERRSVTGDATACALLLVSLASFGVGVAFALGAGLSIWLGGRREWRRAWVPLLPIAVYLGWFLWARKFDQSQVSAEALSGIFSGMADQLAAIAAAISGLFRVPGSAELAETISIRPEWGYPLAVVLAGLAVLHAGRRPRSIRFWTVAGILVAYLALVALGLDEARAPNASRYVYLGGVFTLLLVAELARDVRWSTAVGLVAFVLLCLSLMTNVGELRAGGRLFAAEGDTNRATLAALELSRDRVDPNLPVEDGSTAHSHPDMLFPAWAYFEAAGEFGSPAFDLEQLEGAGGQAREAADQELVRALAIGAEPLADRRPLGRPVRPKPLSADSGRALPAGRCLVLIPAPGREATFQLELPPGGFAYRIAPQAEATVTLGRFGDLPTTELRPFRGSAEVAIPPDAAATPWLAELRTEVRTLACPR